MSLRVDPGALGDAAGVIRRAHDDGAVLLARAIVRDLLDGVDAAEKDEFSAVFGTALPQLIELLGTRGGAIGHELGVSAHSYARADELHPAGRR